MGWEGIKEGPAKKKLVSFLSKEETGVGPAPKRVHQRQEESRVKEEGRGGEGKARASEMRRLETWRAGGGVEGQETLGAFKKRTPHSVGL